MTAAARASLLTVGHGTLPASNFSALLQGAGVELLVDVRSFPGSRANPQFTREAMEQWLPDGGTAYRWERRLGGRRRLPKGTPSPDTWWHAEAFRAYSAYTRTPEWRLGFASLLSDVASRRVAICCSEAVWWRCHRRIIADVVSLTQPIDVLDLAHDGRLTQHPVAEGARVGDDGQVVWDAGAEPLSTNE